jgi:hypothetical protein
MFSRSPIFLNANDVLNITDIDLNIQTDNSIKTDKKTDIKLSLEEKLLNDNVKEQIELHKIEENNKKNELKASAKYPGDDIPWIF